MKTDKNGYRKLTAKEIKHCAKIVDEFKALSAIESFHVLLYLSAIHEDFLSKHLLKH